MERTILLIGLGGLGSTILELLARTEGIGRIVAADRDADQALARCNLARMGAMAQGFAPALRFQTLDLNDQEAVVDVVARVSPDLVLHTASLQPWWLPDRLPPERAGRIKSAGFGVWLPVHMTLTLKLMQALNAAGYRGLVLTAPFPDVIHPVLGRLGLAPTCGVGNLDEIVPKVRLLAAERLGVPPSEVHAWLVAHHALEPYVFQEPGSGALDRPAGEDVPPFYLRIEHAGRDVTSEIAAEELLLAPYPIPPGPASHTLTAGSTVRLIQALFSATPTLLHAPGPHGLPGGYPVRVGGGRVELAPIPGCSLEDAVAINERSHRFDGIERIEDDGTVVFCPEAAAVLRRELGYDCERLPPHESEERAGELIARFRAYAGWRAEASL